MERFEERVTKAILSRINRTKEDPNWIGNGYVMNTVLLSNISKVLQDPDCRVVIFTKAIPDNLKISLENSGIIVYDDVSSDEEVFKIMEQYSTDNATVELV